MVVVAFSSLARNLGECSTIHSPPAFFFFFRGEGLVVVVEVDISSRTLIAFFMPGAVHSGLAS